jgi:recombinational DNA repair protein RecT
VYTNDVFEYERGLEPKLIHRPAMQGPRGEFSCVYAVYHLKSGFSDFVVLSREDVESYRRRSPAQKGEATGAWKTDYAAMAKKTAIRRIAPYLPMQVDDLDRAVAVDERVVNLDDFAMDNSGQAYVSAEIIDTDTGEVTQAPQPVETKAQKKDRILEEIQKLSPGREIKAVYASSAVQNDMDELPNVIE